MGKICEEDIFDRNRRERFKRNKDLLETKFYRPKSGTRVINKDTGNGFVMVNHQFFKMEDGFTITRLLFQNVITSIYDVKSKTFIDHYSIQEYTVFVGPDGNELPRKLTHEQKIKSYGEDKVLSTSFIRFIENDMVVTDYTEY